MRYLKYFLFLVSIANLFDSRSQIVRQLDKDILQYQKVEFLIQLNGKFKNPYDRREIELNMILFDPNGDSLYLPCYFESQEGDLSQWRARFAPQEVGRYNYYFQIVKSGNIRSEFGRESFLSTESDNDGFLHINDLWTLKFDSGKPFRGIGENVGWDPRSYSDPKYTYEYLLPTLSSNGANFFRSWMAPNNFPLEWKQVVQTNRYQNTDKHFNPGGIQRFDEVVELAKSLGLYMMVAFDSHNTLMEERQWKIHNYNAVNGGPARNPTEFFTSPKAREMYKNRLRYIVARWGYSTSIGAWEFFNEIDNAAFTRSDSIIIPHKAIKDWHQEMAAFLKSIDPYNHIVTTSVSHREIEGVYALEELDLNQMHVYKRTKQIPPEILMYVNEYNKPFSWGEFGYEWDWNKDFSEFADEMDHDYKIGLWYGLFSPTPILPMTWWWEFFDERNMTPYFKSVSTINKMMLGAGNGKFERLAAFGDGVEVFAVECGDTCFIYVLNDSGDKRKSDLKIEIPSENVYSNAQSFDPETGKFSTFQQFKAVDGVLRIPNIELQDKEGRVFIVTE